MNIYLHELKAYRKSILTWVISVSFVAVVLMSIYPTFSESADELKKLLSGYPPMILRAFGLNPDELSFFLGFYSFVFTYVTLCGAIQAMNLGTSLVSKETTLKTADFILTKPISRKRILTAKLSAGLTAILLTNLAFIGTALTMASIVNPDPYDMGRFLLITLSLLFIQLIFIAIGFIISVLANKIKSVASVSLGVVFGFFIISMLRAALENEDIRYISPFDYFNAEYVIKNAAYETMFLVIGAVFFVSAITAGYAIFIRKDIHAV